MVNMLKILNEVTQKIKTKSAKDIKTFKKEVNPDTAKAMEDKTGLSCQAAYNRIYLRKEYEKPEIRVHIPPQENGVMRGSSASSSSSVSKYTTGCYEEFLNEPFSPLDCNPEHGRMRYLMECRDWVRGTID